MTPHLPWLSPEDPFPPSSAAWNEESPLPGLLAAGGKLDAQSLKKAYAQGVFPWFSDGQPILWWSPNPRMVLQTSAFKLHPSLKKTIRKFIRTPKCEIRIDFDFETVIHQCAHTPREDQDGTWIDQRIKRAYLELHQQGKAHSVETWIDGQLCGGLYCVGMGRAVFGESMFSHRTNASKIALAALVGLCRHQGASQIDCQQATSHLSSLGAQEVDRESFLSEVERQLTQPDMHWEFDSIYWDAILMPSSTTA